MKNISILHIEKIEKVSHRVIVLEKKIDGMLLGNTFTMAYFYAIAIWEVTVLILRHPVGQVHDKQINTRDLKHSVLI